MIQERPIACSPRVRVSRARVGAAAALLALTGVALLSEPGRAQSRGLDGYWRGHGSVAFASGPKERAQCRARYRRTSRGTYSVTATCATPSGRATQRAILRRTGDNTYRGHFHNSEYDVSGTIYVTVGGNRQSVRLISPSGSATLALRR